ncbi:hypothetical protein FJ366_00595 [Candidatus Dependentiae bacterium]|nr:hypothetical protein [Candidatus Dependentiae bacterium]
MMSVYYRARLVRNKIWFLTAVLRSAEGYVLERTLEGTSDVMEFFVSPSYVFEFEQLLAYFQKQGIVVWFQEFPNRIKIELDLQLGDISEQ